MKKGLFCSACLVLLATMNGGCRPPKSKTAVSPSSSPTTGTASNIPVGKANTVETSLASKGQNLLELADDNTPMPSTLQDFSVEPVDRKGNKLLHLKFRIPTASHHVKIFFCGDDQSTSDLTKCILRTYISRDVEESVPLPRGDYRIVTQICKISQKETMFEEQCQAISSSKEWVFHQENFVNMEPIELLKNINEFESRISKKAVTMRAQAFSLAQQANACYKAHAQEGQQVDRTSLKDFQSFLNASLDDFDSLLKSRVALEKRSEGLGLTDDGKKSYSQKYDELVLPLILSFGAAGFLPGMVATKGLGGGIMGVILGAGLGSVAAAIGAAIMLTDDPSCSQLNIAEQNTTAAEKTLNADIAAFQKFLCDKKLLEPGKCKSAS